MNDKIRTVCYVDVGADDQAIRYCDIVKSVVRDLGLTPVTYLGARSVVRRSNVDRELRDDFYNCHVAIVRLPADQESWEDSWAFPEIRKDTKVPEHAQIKNLIVYLDEAIAGNSSAGDAFLSLPGNLADVSEFPATLKADLQKFL